MPVVLGRTPYKLPPEAPPQSANPGGATVTYYKYKRTLQNRPYRVTWLMEVKDTTAASAAVRRTDVKQFSVHVVNR